MDKTIQRIARIAAIMAFFVMALAGWFSHGDPAVCAWRSIIGAIVMYTAVRIAGAMLVKIVIDAMVRDEMKKNNHGDKY
jgi:hypothetical protein